MVPVSLRKDTRLGAAEVVSDRARHPSPSFSGGGRVRPGEVVRDSAAVRAPPQIGTSPPRSDNDTAGDAVATDLGRTDGQWDAVKFGEASRSLGRHKAAHRQTITHRLRRRRLQRDGPQRKPFSGGFVVAAAEKEGEKSSLPPLLLVPANSHLRNEEGNCGEQEEGEEETRKGKSPRVLPLFRSVLESGGDLPRALHTSVIPSNRVSSSSVVVANFCTPSAHRPPAELVTSFRPRQKHKGRLRCGARRAAAS